MKFNDLISAPIDGTEVGLIVEFSDAELYREVVRGQWNAKTDCWSYEGARGNVIGWLPADKNVFCFGFSCQKHKNIFSFPHYAMEKKPLCSSCDSKASIKSMKDYHVVVSGGKLEARSTEARNMARYKKTAKKYQRFNPQS